MTHVEPSPQRSQPGPAGSFPNAWTLFRVQGIPVRLDRSWLLIAGVIVYFFFGRLQVTLPEIPTPGLLAISAIAAVLFFASILGHELGHALVSRALGIPVLAITLFAMGGVTESTREARRARDEFMIVGIGPFISFVLAVVFRVLLRAVDPVGPAAEVLGYLAWTNLALAIFNVVPGYPLDGGRLLRSVLWGITGKPHQATRWAARVGQVFALALMAIALNGFLGVFVPPPGILRDITDMVGGLWTVFIGFFLLRGATSSHKRASLREWLQRRTVREVMGSVPPPLSPGASLAEALVSVQERPSLLWPVGDPVQGALLLADIDAVPSEHWDTTTTAEVARDAAEATVPIHSSLDDAVELMLAAPHNMLIVTDAGRPVGLLTPSLVSQPVSQPTS